VGMNAECERECREVGVGILSRMYAFVPHIHYRSKVWGHLEMSLFFIEKHSFFNKDNINQKYTLYIVNVVNDYSRWKCLVSNEISP